MSESPPPSDTNASEPTSAEAMPDRPQMPDVSGIEPVGLGEAARARDPKPLPEQAGSAPPAAEAKGGAGGSSAAAVSSGGAASVTADGCGSGELGRVLEIPLVVHVELGRRRMRISELLSLQPGSVLELDAEASAPLAIYANRTLVAHGEAVVVGDHYGVRITRIVSPEERAVRLAGGRR